MNTSLERVFAAIGHKEADRVPLFLLLSLYGAKELDLPIKEYFSNADNIVKAQLLMREKYSNDCLYSFFYASIEFEAWGGKTIFVEDGPPNSSTPFIQSIEDINNMTVPKIHECSGLSRVLEATRKMKAIIKDQAPIIGVVMSPFSLPVMQMGFEKYLELLYFDKEHFNKLMKINEEFCINWANAQLEAGATAICFFDPLASPNIISRDLYLETGHKSAKRTIASIKGATATHLASGITIPVIEDIINTKTAVLGFSNHDDIKKAKELTKDRLCLLGNLNGLDMVNWTEEIAEKKIKDLIAKAGIGGGLIISDNHGELPYQVDEKILLAISKAVKKWGQYPLDWVLDNE